MDLNRDETFSPHGKRVVIEQTKSYFHRDNNNRTYKFCEFLTVWESKYANSTTLKSTNAGFVWLFTNIFEQFVHRASVDWDNIQNNIFDIYSDAELLKFSKN